jgi:hypothetical protein
MANIRLLAWEYEVSGSVSEAEEQAAGLAPLRATLHISCEICRYYNVHAPNPSYSALQRVREPVSFCRQKVKRKGISKKHGPILCSRPKDGGLQTFFATPGLSPAPWDLVGLAAP